MILRFPISLLITLLIISCSNPESDGKKAAQALNECSKNFNINLEKEIHEFITNFDDYSFKTRIEARAKVDKIIAIVSNIFEQDKREAEQLYQDLKNKYITNYEQASAFDYAYKTQLAIYEAEEIQGIPYSIEIENKIHTIIPPKPSIDKIKLDLVGHTWQDRPDGYFPSKKEIIKSGSVKNINILSEKENNDTYTLNTTIFLQERVGSATFILDADIKYLLGDNDDWMIDHLGINSVDIKKTGEFNKYITSTLSCPWVDHQLDLKNHSDATLIVGGIYLATYPKGWNKFYAEIGPNSSERIGGMGSGIGDVLEYEIHFVERR